MTPDPSLPLGRIPIVAYADNGVGKSNVVFVNVFYPQPGQTMPAYNRYPHPSKNTGEYFSDIKQAVFRNKRPVVRSTLTNFATTVTRGNTARFDLACTDPEGKPTRLYRWLGEAGTLAGNTFTFPTAANDPVGVRKVHFVCSDGTGGFAGTEVTITVQ